MALPIRRFGKALMNTTIQNNLAYVAQNLRLGSEMSRIQAQMVEAAIEEIKRLNIKLAELREEVLNERYESRIS
jgi:cob(I)alamin adenosyltransferase